MFKLPVKRPALVFFGLALAFSLVLLVLSMTVWRKAPSYPIARHIQYGFTLQNQTDTPIEKAEFWTYAPVKESATQRCEQVLASHPYELTVDDLGNQVLHFVFPLIPPHGAKIINIGADLKLSDKANQLPSGSLDAFLIKEKFVELDDPDLIKLGKGLKTLSTAGTAESIFHWVANNIRYSGYAQSDRGALYALRHKEGDCTEFMYLLTALCRADGIPSRGVAGYVCPSDTVLKPANFHNWAEVYISGFWQIADAQRRAFGQNPSQYIAMRVIEESPDPARNPMGEFHRFRFLGDGLKVTMNQ